MASEFDTMIQSTLQLWSKEYLAYVKQNAKVIPQASSKGAESISNTTSPTRSYFHFLDYMRMFEFKKINQDDMPPIEQIEEWIKAKGVSKFTSGIKRKSISTTTDPKKLLNRIAWGIAISKIGEKRKRKAWFSKGRETKIRELYRTMLNNAADLYSKNTLKALKNG